MNRKCFGLVIAICSLAPLALIGQEAPDFWLNQDGWVRHLSLETGLGPHLADLDSLSGIEMKDPNVVISPSSWAPIPSFPSGAARIQQLKLSTQELETLTWDGPALAWGTTFDSEGYLWAIGTEDLINVPSIVRWDLDYENPAVIPTDISPRYLLGLASYGGFLYGVTAEGYPPSFAPYRFVEIDWETAETTELNDDLLPASSTFVGMDFDDHGILWMAYEVGGNLEIGRISNLNTLEIDVMGSYPALERFYGMAVAPRGDIIAIPTLDLRSLFILTLLIGVLGTALLRSVA